MSFTLDHSQDYKVWDHREAVSYTVHGLILDSGGYEETYSISDAKRRNITAQDIPTQRTGIFTGHDLVWLIPQAVLPAGVVPNPSDFITDSSGRNWTVLDTQFNNLQSTWRLNCRDLVLAENLRQAIGLYRTANTRDPAGGRTPNTYSMVLGNVPARIQETGTESMDLLGKKQVKTRYDCHCGKRLAWKSTDRIIDQDGVTYQIVSGTAPDVMDVLQVLNLERIS